VVTSGARLKVNIITTLKARSDTMHGDYQIKSNGISINQSINQSA